MFTQLHIHTSMGSRLDAISSSYDYAKRASELGHTALAITDHGSMTGVFEHQKACDKYGIKPIFGVEAYIADNLINLNDKGKRQRDRNNHIVLLAKNEIGYKNLLKINYISMKDEEHFYYTNRITQEELFENSEGIIVGTACIGSKWGRLLREGKREEAAKLFEEFAVHFGEDFYAEVQLNELNYEMEETPLGQKSVNDFLIEQANKLGVPVVLTGDVHYLKPGQDQVQTISIAIKNKSTIDNLSFEIESKNLYYHDVQDYLRFNEEFGYNYPEEDIKKWAKNSRIIADKCNYRIPERTRMYMPSITEDDDLALVKESVAALNKMFDNNPPKEYRDRMMKELEVLLRKGFSSYVLVLKEMIDFVLSEGYMTAPGRGCFVEDSLVKTSSGYKKIKDIEKGELVIAGTGKERVCLDKYVYDIEEEIIELGLGNGRKIECTLDHKILILPKNKNRFEEAIWKKAGDLMVGDRIVKV